MSDITWGTEVRRREQGIPYLQYEPRRRRVPALVEDAQRWRDRTHLVQGERRITFEQFFAGVDATAAELAQRGIGPGATVLLLAANCPEWVVSFWAVARTGAVVAPGNGWWSEEEVDHVLSLINPSLVIGDPKRLAKVTAGCAYRSSPGGSSLCDRGPLPQSPAGASAGHPPPSIDLAEVRSIVDGILAGKAAPDFSPPAGSLSDDEDEAAVIVFTSGTTGFPKGATLAHRSVIANLHDLLAVSGRLPQQVDAVRPGAVNLVTGPLFHIGGIQMMCLGLVGGGTLVFLEGRFNSTEVLDLIEQERVTVWGGVPTMARRVLEDPTLPGRDLTSVRSVSLGGSPVPPELIGRLRDSFSNAQRGVSTVYGMTEAGGTVAAAGGALMAQHPGTSGRPQTLVDLKIDNPDTEGVGEVCVRTPAQMLGYWGETAAGAGAAIDADGFLHTGDLGRLDDGLLSITGRSKDLIIRGGENIAAPRVEAVILEHPDVVEVAVVGLPHEDLGEEVGAALLLRGGAMDPSAVAEFCTTKLAHFEVPSRWWVRTEPLPTNDAGKVDKRTLRGLWPSDS